MKNFGMRRLWTVGFLMACFLATSTFFACNSTEPGEPTFNIKAKKRPWP